MKCFNKAGTLLNHKKASFIMPFSLIFSFLQLSLLLLLISYSQQQGLVVQYKELSNSFVHMEKASRTLMLKMIQSKGHIETSQWISQQATYWWDLNGDSFFDAVSVFSLVNVKSDEIEWVAIHYVLKDRYSAPLTLPMFETRIVLTSPKRAKMIHHAYVRNAKAVYRYVFNLTQSNLSPAKISIPTNETN
jgi:hypothetical protein